MTRNTWDYDFEWVWKDLVKKNSSPPIHNINNLNNNIHGKQAVVKSPTPLDDQNNRNRT